MRVYEYCATVEAATTFDSAEERAEFIKDYGLDEDGIDYEAIGEDGLVARLHGHASTISEDPDGREWMRMEEEAIEDAFSRTKMTDELWDIVEVPTDRFEFVDWEEEED